MQFDVHWPRRSLGSLVHITSGKRNSSEAVAGGRYPFFTCGREVLRIDIAEHDREAVLLGGNNANAIFPVFYANGPFTARQRVYVTWSRDEDVLSNRFLYYALKELASSFTTSARGTTTLFITLPMLQALEIPLPDIEVQRSVAALLSDLDWRIDLLRQTNATLESIAQALFKSWFIDFDPVRGKAEGREPECMDPATAALFPAEFEESPLGLVPKGWRISTLAEHVLADRGLSYKGVGLCGAGEGLPMHNLNSVLEGGGYKYAGMKHYSGDYKDRHIALAGDVIVANTEQGHEHRLIGFPAIVPSRYERAIYSHHIYRVRPKPDSPLTPHVLYYTLMAPAVREQVVGCANGSTVNMLKAVGLEIPRFICPSADVAKAFEELAKPLRMQMEANVERAETLAALRDTLLPRLISGRLRVSEAQAQLEEASA